MNNIGIIIQKLQGNGLDFNVFPNVEISELRNKYNDAIEDERNTPGKVGDKPIFVLHNTQNYKIYSLIIGTRDAGRAGFYALRVFISDNYILQNFTTILDEVHAIYLSNPNINFDDIHLYNETIIKVKNNCKKVNNYIFSDNLKNNKFIYYDHNNILAIESVFNSKETFCISKLYAFQKPNNELEIREEISIQSIVYHKYSINEDLQEIKITGQLKLLKKLEVNGNEVNFNPNSDELILLKYKSDNIEYFLHEDGRKIIDEFNNEITISRKDNYTKDRNRNYKTSIIDEYGTWFLLFGFIVIILIVLVETKIIVFKNPDINENDSINISPPDTINKVSNDSIKKDTIDSKLKTEKSKISTVNKEGGTEAKADAKSDVKSGAKSGAKSGKISDDNQETQHDSEPNEEEGLEN